MIFGLIFDIVIRKYIYVQQKYCDQKVLGQYL